MNTTCEAPPPVDQTLSETTGPVLGVKTTRIYCRMVCRAGRGPRRENCVPFLNPAAARAAGYRACKVCRPDDPDWSGPKAEPVPVRYGVGVTPVGWVFVARSERGVCSLFFLDSDDPAPALARLKRDRPVAPEPGDVGDVVSRTVDHLSAGRSVDDVPLDLRGTPFQLRVWEALRAIPRGETTSYGALAVALGLPVGASRAVGTACGANPVALIVPCHRVLRTGGGLGGFGGGLDRKRVLLDLERG